MIALFWYLLQVMVASGILYTYYHFVLRNNRFHHYNRFYLLASTLISITIPFLNIPVYFSASQTDSSMVLKTLTVFSGSDLQDAMVRSSGTPAHPNGLSWSSLAYLFYILIGLLVTLRIILSVYKIKKLISRNQVEKLNEINFVNTDEPGTPFSFFRWLFWNNKIELHSEKGEQIFRHELFHIKQKHSYDTIYMELLCVPFWINPFFHVMKKEVKAIHEFLADQYAVTENKKWDYAEMLLMQVLNTHHRLVNPFFHNQIKRRIAMITNSSKPAYQYLRKIMVLPVAMFVLLLCAFTYKEKHEAVFNSPTVIRQNIPDTTSPPVKVQGVKLTNTPASADDKVFTKVEVDPAFPGGDAQWRLYLEKNLDASIPVNRKAPDGAYTVIVQFIVDKAGNITDVITLTHHGYGMEEEAMRVIKKGPAWLPAVQNGYQVKAIKKQPITFVVGKGDNRSNKNTNASSGNLNEIVVTGFPLEAAQDNKVFTKTEIPPSFPGADTGWRKYLERNVNAAVPVDNGAPAGIYKVMVQFIVNADGSLSDFKPLTNHGYGMEKEAMRLIAAGPKWKAAIQNGKVVTAYMQQPITFVVEEEPVNTGVKPAHKSTNHIP